MAKDSFILSQTRGAVGNVVVRRSNGKTVVSAKPITVSNPRTYAQAETRMRLSAVSAFYSPLSTVLQQGVQGKNTPNSHSAFSSEAIGIMKAGGYAFPKGGGFFPYPFRLTRGSIPSVGATIGSDGVPSLTINYSIPEQTGIDFTSVGGFTYYLQSILGIDATKFQATFIAIQRQTRAGISMFFPRYFRVACDRSSAVSFDSVLPSWIHIDGTPAGGDDSYPFLFTPDMVACAIIVSYYDGRKWLRSTEFLSVLTDVLDDRSSAEAYDLAVSSFMAAASATDPDGRVYLDGYTRRASGGGSEVDWSKFPVKTMAGASVTAKCTGVTTTTVGSNTVIALTFSDGTTKTLSGNEKMISFGKAFLPTGGAKPTLTTEQQANAVYFDYATDEYFTAYAAVADHFGLSLGYMFGGE